MRVAARLRQPPRPRARLGGFTLIEMMVALTVLGVLMVIAVPSFNNAILGNKLSGYANNFIGSAQLARSEAIKRNAQVVMCRSSDGASCAGSGGWQQGWIIFADNGALTHKGNGVLDSDETRIQYQQGLGADFAFTGSVYTIVFESTGLNATPVTTPLVLCRANPVGTQERAITVSATGRASATTTRNGTCPT